MSDHRTNASDLWPAICDLTQPQAYEVKRTAPGEHDWAALPLRLQHATVAVEHTTLPSLWDQLLEADARAGGSGSSKPGSRPPISVEVVQLVDEIRTVVARLMVEHNRRYIRNALEQWPGTCPIPLPEPTGDVPADLTKLNDRYRADPNRAADLAHTIRKWITTATDTLGLERPKSSYVRVPCMVCNATMVPEQLPGETEPRMRPALRLIWQGETARATECRACGDTRWPGDFHELAAAAGQASATRETLSTASEGNGW